MQTVMANCGNHTYSGTRHDDTEANKEKRKRLVIDTTDQPTDSTKRKTSQQTQPKERPATRHNQKNNQKKDLPPGGTHREVKGAITVDKPKARHVLEERRER
jgi:hypothetical protein